MGKSSILLQLGWNRKATAREGSEREVKVADDLTHPWYMEQLNKGTESTEQQQALGFR